MKTKITYRFAGKIMMITLAALITVTCDRVKDDPYYEGHGNIKTMFT